MASPPEVTVEIGDERYAAVGRPLRGADRERAGASITAANPFFLEHEERAGRTIPVVELVRSGAKRPQSTTPAAELARSR